MKTIKLIKLIFKQKLSLAEIPYFRSAIVDSFELRASLYDNHDEKGADLYQYPFIQYKLNDRQQASIFFMEAGADLFLQEPLDFPKKLRIGKRQLNFKIDKAPFSEYQLQVTPDKFYHYTISNWMALNQKNYPKYKVLHAKEKIQFLEDLLANHIISFCKGIHWHPKQRFELSFTDIPSTEEVFFKDGYKKVFTISFIANIQLPDFVGLGKSPSVGFGVVSFLG